MIRASCSARTSLPTVVPQASPVRHPPIAEEKPGARSAPFSPVQLNLVELQFSDHETRASCSLPLALIARPPLAFPWGSTLDGALETKIGDEISALVLDRVMALHALER